MAMKRRISPAASSVRPSSSSEEPPDLVGADLIQLVHGAHDVAGLLRQAQHGVEAVEDLPVVHPDLEPLQPQG